MDSAHGDTVRSGEGLRRAGDQPDELAAKLRDAIVAGELAAGTALRQEELARRLNASRMPVREALRILTVEGFVVMRPNRGAVVAPIDLGELDEIVDLRIAMETMALRYAIPRLSDEQIDTAAGIQDRIDESDAAGFTDLNRAFHLALYTPADRPLLLRQIVNLHRLSDRYLRLAVGDLGLNAKSSREHRALLEACYRRDPEEAFLILTDHIASAGRAVHDHLRRAA